GALSRRALRRAAPARRAGARADARSAHAASRRAAGRARSARAARAPGRPAGDLPPSRQDRRDGDARPCRGRVLQRPARADAARARGAGGQHRRFRQRAGRRLRAGIRRRASRPARSGRMRRMRAFSWLCAWLVAATVAAGPPARASVTIGSKDFTESVVLGEVARLAATGHGIEATHRRSLGGTRILWRALREGEIDAYPEYTGTIVHELLRDLPGDAGIDALRARLRELGIGMADPLGFDNGYAIGMREETAAGLGIDDISDLAEHAGLRIALSNEFMDRADGWPGLKAAYRLPMDARGMDHALAYRALASGAVDAIDLYGTDAEIAYYGLRVLRDDRGHFPRYDAVYLYRLDLDRRAPGFVATLDGLAGAIAAPRMRAMNKAVKLDGEPEERVAARLLGIAPGAGAARGRAGPGLLEYTLQHMALVGVSLSLAILLAVPLGVLAARRRRLGQLVLGLTG